MKKRQLSLIIAIIVILSASNLVIAQGQGNGNGKGLLENRGLSNGQGFTKGQGHLNGNSAVELTCDIESLVEQKIMEGEVINGSYIKIVKYTDEYYQVTSYPRIYSFELYRNEYGACDAYVVWIANEEE
jgi:hypothetical protein